MAGLSEALGDKEFCLLTTFKKTGDPVSTVMWFALRGETVYLTTRGQSWKMKRIRREPQVTIGWSSSSGSSRGKLFEAIATEVLDPEERESAIRLLNKKYGLKKRLMDFGLRFAKDRTEAVIRVEAPGEEFTKL